MKKLLAIACAALVGICAAYAEPLAIGTLWEATTYVEKYGESGAKVGEGVSFGAVELGKNVKAVNKGAGVAGTIGAATKGYVQVSNGDAGSLKVTVPAGTSKITICAKAVNGKAFQVKEGKNVLLKANGTCKKDYEDHVITKKFDADTELLISGATDTNCNIKAIKIE